MQGFGPDEPQPPATDGRLQLIVEQMICCSLSLSMVRGEDGLNDGMVVVHHHCLQQCLTAAGSTSSADVHLPFEVLGNDGV